MEWRFGALFIQLIDVRTNFFVLADVWFLNDVASEDYDKVCVFRAVAGS